jgi:Tfp pilus assembly protein PilO
MNGPQLEIWRQRVWVWAVALAFLVLNGFGFLIYKVGYADRVTTLRGELADQNHQTTDARAEFAQQNDLLRQAKVNRQGILQLYDDHFSTRRRRLTGVTAEVRMLATRAGLTPRSINYPEEQIQQYGLIKRSFIFSVEGSYADLRKFVNLLELSESFLTLESVSLAEENLRRAPAGGVGGAGGRPGAFGVPGAAGSAGAPPGATAFHGVGIPGASLAPAGAPASAGGGTAPSAPGAPLHMNLTLSTLFAARDESQDAFAPLPGSTVTPRGRQQP